MNARFAFLPHCPLSKGQPTSTAFCPRLQTSPSLIPLTRAASSTISCKLQHPPTQPPQINPQPQVPTRRPILRNTLLALLAAFATYLTPTPRPSTATTASESTIARALPKSSTLSDSPSQHTSTAIRLTPKETGNSSGGHGLEGTSFAVAGTAALLASTLAVTITHPIDTIKTRHQARAAGTSTKPLTLNNMYCGVLSNIAKEAPNAAIYLATYEVFKAFLITLPGLRAVPLLAMCVAGMLGDAVGSVVRVPAEIINKRLQLGLSPDWSSAINDSFMSQSGVESTIASWYAVLLRDVPYGGLQIAAYEFFRLVFARFALTGILLGIVAGSIAGLFAAVITTPADVLVTRMSTQSPQCYLETHSYMSPSATFIRIIKTEGFGALWSGAFHRGLFYMPMIGIFFAAYESFKFLIVNPPSMVVLAKPLMALGALFSFAIPLHLAILVALSSAVIRRDANHTSSVKW